MTSVDRVVRRSPQAMELRSPIRPEVPFSEDAEQAVLSAMMFVDHPEAVTRASEIVDPAMFYTERHRRIFVAMLALAGRGVTIDPITVTEELTSTGVLESIGGKDYIGFLVDAVPTAANVEYHAQIVARRAQQRFLSECYGNAQKLALEGKLDAQEIIRQTAAALETIKTVNDGAPVFVSLADLRKNPELLKPPIAVVPRIGYRGRTTLLVASDKGGKSTLAADATASVSRRGHFFGEPTITTSAYSLWVGLEESLGDAVRRADEMESDPERVELLTRATPKLLDAIRSRLTASDCDFVLVDSLTEFARVTQGKVPEDGDSSGWASVIRPLVALTREFPNTALLILHHPRRSDGQFRGSGEIAAAVDCLLEMRGPAATEDPTLRHVTGRARWPVPAFDVRFVNGHYELSGGAELSVDARIILQVEQHAGVGIRELRRLVGGRSGTVDRVASELVMRGAILDLGKGKEHEYHPIARATAPVLDLVS